MLQKGRYFKAFALSGRQACSLGSQGDCPGLGASALSGRADKTWETPGRVDKA